MNIAWAYGNPPSRQDAIQLIRNAYEQGARFFDTAEIYGPHSSELITGEALKPYRNEVVIASKIGFDIDFATGQMKGGLNSKPQHIKEAVDYMLKRLQTDHIDLLYQHRIDPTVPIEDVAGTMAELIKEGKIRHYGLSEVGSATIRRAHTEHPVTAVLAVVAIVIAMLLIAWARVEVHGTDDLAALVEERSTMSNTGAAENEAASSRWATGFSH